MTIIGILTDTLQLHNLLEPNIHKIKNEENLC